MGHPLDEDTTSESLGGTGEDARPRDERPFRTGGNRPCFHSLCGTAKNEDLFAPGNPLLFALNIDQHRLSNRIVRRR
jgi:hypothetical protein